MGIPVSVIGSLVWFFGSLVLWFSGGSLVLTKHLCDMKQKVTTV
jgi:hypothetical protein